VKSLDGVCCPKTAKDLEYDPVSGQLKNSEGFVVYGKENVVQGIQNCICKLPPCHAARNNLEDLQPFLKESKLYVNFEKVKSMQAFQAMWAKKAELTANDWTEIPRHDPPSAFVSASTPEAERKLKMALLASNQKNREYERNLGISLEIAKNGTSCCVALCAESVRRF